jgi:hypothetical protein
VTVTAPPRPPAPGDPVDWSDPEALIAEAKQRARRRRRRYAAVVAVLALLATSVIVVFGRPDPSQSLSPGPPRTLPIAPDPDDAASIVAKYGGLRGGGWARPGGWVVVYGDGRVITSDTAAASGMAERRLTAKGLDLVRSGAIQPRALLSLQDRMWHCTPNCVEITRAPGEVWADAEVKPYLASRYAACLGTSGHPDVSGIPPGQATELVGRLPAAARPLLRGEELRAYSNDLFSPSDLGLDPWPPESPDECFEVSTRKAIALYKTLRRAGFAFGWVIGDHDEGIRPAPPPPWAGEVRGPCGAVEKPAAIEVCFMPLLPHGQWYEMGG